MDSPSSDHEYVLILSLFFVATCTLARHVTILLSPHSMQGFCVLWLLALNHSSLQSHWDITYESRVSKGLDFTWYLLVEFSGYIHDCLHVWCVSVFHYQYSDYSIDIHRKISLVAKKLCSFNCNTNVCRLLLCMYRWIVNQNIPIIV